MAVEGISARLYLDHNVDVQLVVDLRRRGFDVTHSRDLNMARATDDEHLRRSAAEGRAILTYDRSDFPRLAEEWAREERGHAGIIISVAPPLFPYGTLLRRLLSLLDSRSADQMADQLVWLNAAWEPEDRQDP